MDLHFITPASIPELQDLTEKLTEWEAEQLERRLEECCHYEEEDREGIIDESDEIRSGKSNNEENEAKEENDGRSDRNIEANMREITKFGKNVTDSQYVEKGKDDKCSVVVRKLFAQVEMCNNDAQMVDHNQSSTQHCVSTSFAVNNENKITSNEALAKEVVKDHFKVVDDDKMSSAVNNYDHKGVIEENMHAKINICPAVLQLTEDIRSSNTDTFVTKSNQEEIRITDKAEDTCCTENLAQILSDADIRDMRTGFGQCTVESNVDKGELEGGNATVEKDGRSSIDECIEKREEVKFNLLRRVTEESVVQGNESDMASSSILQSALTVEDTHEQVDRRQTNCKIKTWMDTWCTGIASLDKPFEFASENGGDENVNDSFPVESDSVEDVDLWMESASNIQGNNNCSALPSTDLVSTSASTLAQYRYNYPRQLVFHPYYPLMGVPYSRVAFPVPRWSAWDVYISRGIATAPCYYYDYRSSMNNVSSSLSYNSIPTAATPYYYSSDGISYIRSTGNTSEWSNESYSSMQTGMVYYNYGPTVVPMPSIPNRNGKS